jgi:hypothetical protein
MRREPEAGSANTAQRGGHEIPVVYGLPGLDMIEGAERGEIILGGCCPPAGWDRPLQTSDDDQESDDTRWDPPLVDGGEGFDNLPTDSVALTGLAVREAEALEVRADELAGLLVVSRGLVGAVEGCTLDPAITDRVARLAAIVQGAADRGGEAHGIALRTLARLMDLIEGAADIDDDTLYEDILTARLHVPIAESIVDDAFEDAIPALRDLARLCLAAAGPLLRDPPSEELHRRARGALRLDLPGLDSTHISRENLELRSATIEDLTFELAGLLAQLMLEHRRFLTVENTEEDSRYLQVITYDRGLSLESVGDDYLPDCPLTPSEKSRLTALGWEAPDPDGNWARSEVEPVDAIVVGALLTRTLVEVHAITDPADLVLTVSSAVDPFGTP